MNPSLTTTGSAAVRTVALTKQYRDPAGKGVVHALRGLELECRYGEIYGLLGPNGAGKSTALRILATMLVPTSGTATIDGFDVANDPLAVRRRIGFLSATTGLYARLTPRETLRYFGRLAAIPREALEARIEQLVAAFRMEEFADRRCEHLSSGQKQRTNIARAVLHDPPVLILDEPTTGLDILATGDMIEFIEARKSANRCVLLSTHVLSEAERLCDRIGVIHHGRLLASGTLEELRERTGEHWLDGVFRALVREAGEEPARASESLA